MSRRTRHEPETRRTSRYDFSKVTVTFESGDDTCEGWLYRPDRPDDPPVVAMAPGLGGERRFGLPRYAERFAERGYAAFAFDYRGFDGSTGDPRHLVSPARQLEDLRSATERLREVDGVDADRLVLWGASLGGGHVLRAAADDVHARAVIAVTPILDARAALRTNGLGTLAKGVAAGVRDRVQSLVLDPHTVPVVGDPGDVALMTAPGATAAFETLVPPGSDWENETPARAFHSLLGYRPVSAASDVGRPTLLVAGSRDEVVPIATVESAAEELPESTLVRMPTGHFDAYRGDGFEQAVGHQLGFLDAVLD